MWQNFVIQIQAWTSTVIACAIGVLLIALTNRILRGRQERRKESHSGILGPLLTACLVGITLVSIALTLPIEEAARGQLLGLLGLLVTAAVALSSTTILGNAMAGIMLRAIRSFRPGDFVRIGEHVGRVSDMGILHTEIQTEDRDLTTLPNLYLITHPLTVLRSSGTVVSATISLGYDIPHHEIEIHLAEAARRAGLSDPFVQVVELGDFSITYRAAGFLLEIKQLLTTRSKLRKAMLDALHEARIEIVSPTFHNLRNLSEHKVILPRQARATSKHQEQDPEARIFDKADAAEAKSKMENEREKCTARIEELEGLISNSGFAAEKVSLEADLSKTKERLESLATMIEPDSQDE